MGQISTLHEEMLASLKEHEILSRNINLEFDQELTLLLVEERIFGKRYIYSLPKVFSKPPSP
jgi:hypothetical protein